MSYDQMVEFVELIHKEVGRYPVVYGGHLLREALGDVTESVLSNCPLWYARYANAPYGIPRIWRTWALWQYTDGNIGPQPQKVRGIGNCDRDTFNGTRQELLQQWPLTLNAVLSASWWRRSRPRAEPWDSSARRSGRARARNWRASARRARGRAAA